MSSASIAWRGWNPNLDSSETLKALCIIETPSQLCEQYHSLPASTNLHLHLLKIQTSPISNTAKPSLPFILRQETKMQINNLIIILATFVATTQAIGALGGAAASVVSRNHNRTHAQTEYKIPSPPLFSSRTPQSQHSPPSLIHKPLTAQLCNLRPDPEQPRQWAKLEAPASNHPPAAIPASPSSQTAHHSSTFESEVPSLL